MRHLVDSLAAKLESEAEASGYHLNPDPEFTHELAEGLLTNEGRYGYPACPCRLASGNPESDADIVCPCDYRDADLGEHGACYCGLYVSEQILKGETKLKPIPERRDRSILEKRVSPIQKGGSLLPFPMWRCRTCGYLCAREGPPEVCPICKVKKERFERFM